MGDWARKKERKKEEKLLQDQQIVGHDFSRIDGEPCVASRSGLAIDLSGEHRVTTPPRPKRCLLTKLHKAANPNALRVID
jgi:hypothetical protein